MQPGGLGDEKDEGSESQTWHPPAAGWGGDSGEEGARSMPHSLYALHGGWEQNFCLHR